MSFLFRRFKSDAIPTSSDLNKKLMEAFTSIIDKGSVKSAWTKPSSPLELIHRYNVENSLPALKPMSAKSHSSAKSNQLITSQAITQQPIISRKNSPDIFRRNKISPINLHKNVYLMSKMLSPSGSILSQQITKLTTKTQRHLSKAIRRARQMGILPYMYRPKVYAVKNSDVQ